MSKNGSINPNPWKQVRGAAGESVAAAFLIDLGYREVVRNYRCRYGEIDLIFRDGDEYVFVEVKTRYSLRYGYPEASVSRKKLQTIQACAQWYLLQHETVEVPWRIDVIALLYQQDRADIQHYQSIDNPRY